MTPAELFVAEARKLKGVKWRHRGRKPWAVDCIGLVAVAGRAAGLTAPDEEGYGREPWNDRLRRGCRERWGEPVATPQAGDIALFKFGNGEPQHMGVLGDHPDGGLTLIHAHNILGVVESRFGDEMQAFLVEVFRPRFV